MARGDDAAQPRSARAAQLHAARRRALEVLFEADVRRCDPRNVLEDEHGDAGGDAVHELTRRLVEGVADNRDEIDRVVGAHARGWRLPRMPVVDRNLLRLGVYELLHQPEVPPAVVIDEAVQLAKELSTDDSPRYVNGVLSAVLREGRPEGD